jgi:serine protease
LRVRLLLGAVAILGVLVAQATAATSAPNDPLYAKQWGIQQINADEAWAISKGRAR